MPTPFGHKVVTDAEEARELVQRYHAEGWDFLKIYTRLDTAVYQAIIEEAARLDFPADGHVPYAVVAENYQLAEAMRTIEHSEEIYQGPLNYEQDEAALAGIARLLKAMDASLTPTLMIFDHLTRIASEREAYLDTLPMDTINPLMRFFTDQSSGKRWLTASEKLTQSLERRNRYFGHITRVLHEHGVRLLLGSDSGVIYSIMGAATHDEIRLLQDAGLPPLEILAMGTVNAADVLGLGDRLGRIAPGYDADLVMSRDNPLDDLATLRTPEAVVHQGQWLDEPLLAQLRANAHQPSSTYLTLGRMLEFFFRK